MAKKHPHALLLQGPMGPFFRLLADGLVESGVTVTKVNFNGGDAFYFRGPEVVPFRKPMDEWPEFFRKLVADRGIDQIYLFGDCRWIHKRAIEIASERGLRVWVFEEGYLRPNHITLEPQGANGNSLLPKDPDFYRNSAKDAGLASKRAKDIPVGHTFAFAAWRATLYVIAMAVLWVRYPNYEHHRFLRPLPQAGYWLRSYWRKKWFASKERDIVGKATGPWKGRYFLVPLQVHCDFQIEHSDYESIPAFIQDILSSFAEDAPKDTLLILKHHPQDRGYRDYTQLIDKLVTELSVSERVHYIHDQHLPTMLRSARGVVTMNSTVGLSALGDSVPVKVMGSAVYDVHGLTYPGTLRDFFLDCGSVDKNLYRCFEQYLRNHNQINGSFYKKLPGCIERTCQLALQDITITQPGSDAAPDDGTCRSSP